MKSEVCLVESEELNSDLKERDLKQDGVLNMISTHKQSSKKDSLKPLFMEILQKSILETYQKWACLQEDSLAKTSQLQIRREQELKGIEVHSGNITARRLGFYDQNTHSLRTYQQSLISDLTLSLQTLPKSGMMQNGIVYQLPQLVRYTREKECSLLLTPTASEAMMGSIFNNNMVFKPTKTGGWRKISNKGDNGNAGLARTIKIATGKFPKASFIEMMMGFPKKWTELNALEMQSYLNVQKSLQKQSKNKRRKDNVQRKQTT